MRNNPVNFNDPTGHMETGPCGAHGEDCGGVPTPPVTPPSSNPNIDLVLLNGLGTNSCTMNTCTMSAQHDSNSCAYGWVSALLTPDGSCGHVEVNPSAVVDPLAWEHIAGGILGGVVLMGFSLIMINISVDLCLGSVPAGALGCVAGIPMGLAGVAGVVEGGVFAWGGFRFAGQYLDEVFEVKP